VGFGRLSGSYEGQSHVLAEDLTQSLQRLSYPAPFDCPLTEARLAFTMYRQLYLFLSSGEGARHASDIAIVYMRLVRREEPEVPQRNA
jgi:hypothetical protein